MNPNKTARVYVDHAGRKRYVGSAHLKQTQHLARADVALSFFRLGTIRRPLPAGLQP